VFALTRLLAGVLAIAACVLAALPLRAAEDASPDTALTKLLQEQRAALPGACSSPRLDRLTSILCSGRIRIGVRDFYPLFGTRTGETREGYEIDVARAVARKLGVDVAFEKVNAASRIPMLADDRVDLVIATMGHNTQRDGEVRFIRPHYYQSETTLVGATDLAIADWKDIAGRTVCVTVGNGSNADLVSRGARLMLFDEAVMLPDRLRDQTCTLAAQDDSFFAFYFTEPHFAERYSQKLGFAQVPWGMAVAREGSEHLGRALDLISQIFHRDGVFLDVARANRVGTGFLERQRAVWRQPECNTATGSINPACVLPALSAALQPTGFADDVTAFESWFASSTGIELLLPMLKTAPAWSLFWNGVVNSLVLVIGALAATLAFALILGAALSSRFRLLRWAARGLTITLQSSPIVLTLVIAAAIIHAMFTYSSTVALVAAILALGLANGSNAGQAISEAIVTIRAERAALHMERMELFSRALGRSATQIVAFLINAAKGTPIASFIGAPELLSALTDITSFSSGRATTYSLLLIFYTAVVMIVVWVCGRFRSFLERSHAPV
jgi:ABC-type amino acid transport substrate-binding protein/ABC-type amino acid transport system permease subunit